MILSDIYQRNKRALKLFHGALDLRKSSYNLQIALPTGTIICLASLQTAILMTGRPSIQ